MTFTSDPTTAAQRSAWDVVIIGAGPAGALAALGLSRSGASVLLVEKYDFPREKVCGGCLNGRALGVLESVGLGTLALQAGGTPIESFRLGQGGREWNLKLPAGMAVARGSFDQALVGAAIDSGTSFLPRTEARVASPSREFLRVELEDGRARRTVEARVVLLATGLSSRGIPGWARPGARIAPRSRIGAGCFLDATSPDYPGGTIHMAVGRDGYVGLIRLADGRLHAAAAIGPTALDGGTGPGPVADRILREAGFPSLGGLQDARWKGTVALTRQTRPLGDHRLLILGDAAGYVEPFTGEGIAWALESGRAIVPVVLRALERWEPSLVDQWGEIHHRLVRHRQSFCRAAAIVLRRPVLVRAAFGAAAWIPGATAQVLQRMNTSRPLVEAS